MGENSTGKTALIRKLRERFSGLHHMDETSNKISPTLETTLKTVRLEQNGQKFVLHFWDIPEKLLYSASSILKATNIAVICYDILNDCAITDFMTQIYEFEAAPTVYCVATKCEQFIHNPIHQNHYLPESCIDPLLMRITMCSAKFGLNITRLAGYILGDLMNPPHFESGLLHTNSLAEQQKNPLGWSKLHMAIIQDLNPDTFNLADTQINDQNNYSGWTPLHLACLLGRKSWGLSLCYAQCDPDARTIEDGRTAHNIARDSGNMEMYNIVSRWYSSYW